MCHCGLWILTDGLRLLPNWPISSSLNIDNLHCSLKACFTVGMVFMTHHGFPFKHSQDDCSKFERIKQDQKMAEFKITSTVSIECTIPSNGGCKPWEQWR